MPRKLACTLAVAVVALLADTGCVYSGSYKYFHLRDYGDDPERFSFQAADEHFEGTLTQSRSIVFLPFVVWLPGHEPFHLRLHQRWRGDESNTVDTVEILDANQNVLFRATLDNGILSPDHSGSSSGSLVSVFTKNPDWDGWYRRKSSTLGWPNTRAVRTGSRMTELTLRITVRRKMQGGTETQRRTTVIHLRRFQANESGLVTDSIFGVTGSMHQRRKAAP